MRIGNAQAVILALPPQPKANPASEEEGQPGSANVLWAASPTMAKALGGSGLGVIRTSAGLSPEKLPNAHALRQLGDVLEIVDGPLCDALTMSVHDGHTSSTDGKLFKAFIKGAEIYCELADPSEEKSKLERALTISFKSLVILEPIADFVPALHPAQPILMGLAEFGDQLLLAMKVHRPEP